MEEDAPVSKISEKISEQSSPSSVPFDIIEEEKNLVKLVSKIEGETKLLDKMCEDNYEEIMQRLQQTLLEATRVSEVCATDYTEKAKSIETVLEALSEYNKKAVEQLEKLMNKALDSAEQQTSTRGMSSTKTCEEIMSKARNYLEVAEKQLEYSKRLTSVTKPLTSWRLDASKSVWEAKQALKSAEQRYTEIKEKEAAKTARPQTQSFRAESAQSDTAPQQSSEQVPDIQVKVMAKAATSATITESSRLSSEEDESGVDMEALLAQPRQPIKFWPKHVYTTADGEVICYVRAPSDCLLQSENLVCTYSDAYAAWPNIPGHHEVIGRYVSIKPLPKRKSCILPNEPWIVGIPHSYVKAASREVVVFMIEAGQRGIPALNLDPKQVHPTELVFWRDLSTTDVVSDEVHYLEIRLARLTQVTFAPCVRLRRDTGIIGRSGGDLICLTEPRIALSGPPGSFKVDLPFTIQVQQMDSHQMRAIKEQNKAVMAEFVSCSPLVYLTCANKTALKPLSLSLPFMEAVSQIGPVVPAGLLDDVTGIQRLDRVSGEEGPSSISSKMQSFGGYDNFQKSLILPQLLAGSRKERFQVTLMQKLPGSCQSWKIFRDAEVEEDDGEVTTFSLREVKQCRLLALKMRVQTEEEILSRCAGVIEQSLSQYMVSIALRQNPKQPSNLCLVLAMPDQIEAALYNLIDEGYTEGSKPQGPVFLNERQVIHIDFRSNIRLVGSETFTRTKQGVEVNFVSSVVNRHKFTVEAVDKFAQHGWDHYRGFLDLFCTRESVTLTGNERPNTPKEPGKFRPATFPVKHKKTRFQVTEERFHLARIVIRLPKQTNPPIPMRPRSSFEFEAKDAVTPKYLRELSRKMSGDTWRRLGAALDLSRTRIQAIAGKTAQSTEDPAYAMLTNWIKKLPVSTNRLTTLHKALVAIGRTDLANELCEFESDSDSEYS